MTYLSYSKLLAVHSLANTIHCNTDITDEVKYDLIFSDKISRFVFNFFNTIRSPLEYYDPDTSYQEDVDAFMSAFNEKINSLDNPKTQQMIQDYLSL